MSETASLRTQLKVLEALQELDIKIDRLKKNQGALPAALRTLDEGLAKLKASTDAKKNQLTEVEKQQRQTQAAQDLNRDRLTRSMSRLEAVQNSQEFQAVNKEIDQLKKMMAGLDETTKKSVTDVEALNKDLAALGEQASKLQGERDAQAQTLSGEGAKLEGEIGVLMKERGRHTSQIDPRILSQYDRVRGARAGLGIVPAIAGRCKGCNMMVPPQLFIEIQKTSGLHQCPSCHRILFVPQAGEADSNRTAG